MFKRFYIVTCYNSFWLNFDATIWTLVPDKCQVDGCCRKGIRGNENVIEGVITCDYCHFEKEN